MFDLLSVLLNMWDLPILCTLAKEKAKLHKYDFLGKWGALWCSIMAVLYNRGRGWDQSRGCERGCVRIFDLFSGCHEWIIPNTACKYLPPILVARDWCYNNTIASFAMLLWFFSVICSKLTISDQCSSHRETSQLICIVNQ